MTLIWLGGEERQAIRDVRPASPGPLSNFQCQTRQRVEPMMTQVEGAQKTHQVRVLLGHVLGASHRMVVIIETPHGEAVRAFAMETGLVQ